MKASYPPENQHDIGKSPFLIENTSSNGCLFIVMCVRGCNLRDESFLFRATVFVGGQSKLNGWKQVYRQISSEAATLLHELMSLGNL